MAQITEYDIEGTLTDYTVIGERNTEDYDDYNEAVAQLIELAKEYKNSGAEVVFSTAQDRFFLINESNRAYRLVDAIE